MSQQFIDRISEVLTEELQTVERWHYLSFAEDRQDGFLGAVVIKAYGIADAILRCHNQSINPGGQVMAVEMPDDVVAQVPESHRNRLLSKKELQEIWPDAKSIREHEEEEAS